MFPDVIETERLRLERLEPDAVDLLEYYEVCSADDMPEVTRYMPWDPHAHPKESEDFLRGLADNRENRKTTDYLIRPLDPEPDVRPRVVHDDEYGPFAGQTGLNLHWDRQLGTFGLWLRKPFWGRGYSGERAAALFEVAFDRLDLEVVAVSHEPGNERSRRAIEKYVERFGGRREGRLRNYRADGGGPTDQVRYSVTREEWAEHRPADLEMRFPD